MPGGKSNERSKGGAPEEEPRETTIIHNIHEIHAKHVHLGQGHINASGEVVDPLENDCEELRMALINEASRRSVIDRFFFCVEKPINLAPLQMTQQQEVADSAENIGHYHHRDDIPTSNSPVGDIEVKEMFDKAKEHAQIVTAKRQHVSDKEKEKETNLHGNMVGIIGQAGIGKTTLSKTILRKILKENMFDVEFIFYLQFREVEFEEKMDLLTFLTKALSLRWRNDQKRRDNVLAALSKNPKVILIMDGLDEAIMNVSDKTVPLTNLHDEVKPAVFIKNILQGTILENVKKIVTSRPRQMLESDDKIRPKYIVNILGLGVEAQYELCKNICDKNSEKVFNYIQQRPPIQTYCYVPSNCIIAMHSINTGMETEATEAEKEKGKEKYMPDTITGVLAMMLCLFVVSAQKRAPRSKFATSCFPLGKIAQLAWDGFIQRKFRFKEEDLKNAGLSPEEQSLFFVVHLAPTSLSILSGDPAKVFYFAHLIIQEFFVALQLIFFIDEKDFEKVVNGIYPAPGKSKVDLTEGNWEMVTKFLYGISNKSTLEKLKEAFSELSNTDISKKIEMLCNFAQNRCMPAQTVSDDHYFQQLLPVCIWTHELNDNDFASEISLRLKRKIIVRGKILASDITPFNYILSHRKSEIELDTTQYETCFVGESLTHFLNAMERYKGPDSFVTVNRKNFELHSDGSVNLTQLIHDVQTKFKVKIPQEIQKTGLEILALTIKHRNEKLKVFHIGGNEIGDDGATALASCVHNIEEIYMFRCNITNIGAEDLGKAIAEMQHSVKWLNISSNDIGDDGLIEIAKCVKNVEKLSVGSFADETITMKGIKAVYDEVSKLEKPMKYLNVRFPPNILDEAKQQLAKCQGKVDFLRIV